MSFSQNMLGQQITVGYFDQNDSFKPLLPRSGRIVRELSLTDWGAGWNLVQLDDPFDYEHTVAEPAVFGKLHVTYILIKSRWEGFAIGAVEPTSVFVFLVPDPLIFANQHISSTDFIHVCWGMVHTNDIQQIVGPERG
jgi:hypothetical protein